MAYTPRYMVYGIQYRIYHGIAWYMVYGIEYVVHGI